MQVRLVMIRILAKNLGQSLSSERIILCPELHQTELRGCVEILRIRGQRCLQLMSRTLEVIRLQSGSTKIVVRG